MSSPPRVLVLALDVSAQKKAALTDVSAQLNSNGHNLHIIASRRTSALRCAPHRAATICLLQRFVSHYPSVLRVATPRNSTQRFVCYNATNSAPHLPSVHRVASLHRASLRNSAQRNDLFVTTLRGLWHCCALRLSATLGSAPQLNNLFVTTQRTAARRIAPRGRAPLRDATQLNDLFVITLRNATQRSPMQLVWPRRAAAHCLSPQLNDLFVTTTTRLVATRRLSTCRIFMQRPAIQRNELKL